MPKYLIGRSAPGVAKMTPSELRAIAAKVERDRPGRRARSAWVQTLRGRGARFAYQVSAVLLMRSTIFMVVLVLSGCSNVVAPINDSGLDVDASPCTDETLVEPVSPALVCAGVANNAEDSFDRACGEAYACPWLHGDASGDESRCDKTRVHDCLEAALSATTCGGFWDAIEAEPACNDVCPTTCP